MNICRHNFDGLGHCDIGSGADYCIEGPCIHEDLVEFAPAAHARWDGEGDGYAEGELVIDVWYCSRCGYCIDDGTDDPTILPNYCPNCGARMDGGGTDA